MEKLKRRRGKKYISHVLLVAVLVIVIVNTTLFQLQLSSRDFDFHYEWHPLYRSDRFPSVEERVKLYMSNWYLPHCHGEDALQHRIIESHVDSWPRVYVSDSVHTQNVTLDSIVIADTPFLFHTETLQECAMKPPWWKGRLPDTDRIRHRKSLRTYCSQVVWLTDYIARMNEQCPVIGLFGDLPPEPMQFPIPLVGKWRAATTNLSPFVNNDDNCWKRGKRIPLPNSLYKDMSPIVWKLETHRHWDPIEHAKRQDTPWHKKKLGALWRGDFTGKYHSGDKTPLEQCLLNQRCAFVYHHADSTLVDAGLTSTLDRMDDTVNGVSVVKSRVSKRQIQQYKVILSMEGNDVASGLKWSLLSESVVLMPTPTRTSWAMEELLEPWVHYIPMKEDGSNAEELIRWVGDNDHKAWRIAERGRLFMYDLLYHPDARRDDTLVEEEIARRYRALWQ